MSIIWSKSVRRITILLAALVVFAGLQVIPSAFAATSVGVTGATPVPGDPLTGTGQVTRTLLTYSDLTTTQNPTAPVDNSAFAIPANAAMPASTFEGTLTLKNVATSGGFQNIPTNGPNASLFNCAVNCGEHLPPFTMSFVQNGSYLVPVNQNLVITHDLQGLQDDAFKDSIESFGYNFGTWNLFVEPGRCWSETTDTGSAGTFSRCSVPFSLVAFDDWGHTSYGLLTFLYNATTISNVRYQVVNETDEDAKFNMWGQLSATYTPTKISNDLAIANLEATTVQNQMPIKPISALATDYPLAGIDTSVFTQGVTPSSVTVYGVVYKGVNYVGGCNTRFGTYPYCNLMRMTPNSSTKSIFPGLALALLVKLYGPGVLSAKLSDYVPQMAMYPNWANSTATFRDAANMASGTYVGSANGMATGDESAGTWNAFLTYAGKVQAALNVGTTHPGEAGSTWSYMNSGMFLLTQAETGFIQSKLGANTDLFTKLVQDVYNAIGLGPGIDTARTDNVAAQTSSPITGRPFGMGSEFVTIDDIAKLATLFQNNGVVNGVQVVDRSSMLSAMQRLTSDTGVPIVNYKNSYPPIWTDVANGGSRYSRAVWSQSFNNVVPNCTSSVTSFEGHGGISTQMYSNGAIYYMFNDSLQFVTRSAYIELNKLAPMCAPTTTSVASSYSTIGQGQTVTFSAYVNAPTRSWSPTGTVQFFDGGQAISPNILLNSNGAASFVSSNLSLGTHEIKAVYSPDLASVNGITSSPAITKLTSSCATSATTCSVESTSGMKVGDNIAMGKVNGTADIHIVTALTPTTITWAGAFQSVVHASGEPVWVQNTAGGGFNTSTSGGFTQTVQAEAVTTTTTTSTTTTTTTLPPTTITTIKKVVTKTITCVKGKLSKKVTAVNPVCPAGYKKK